MQAAEVMTNDRGRNDFRSTSAIVWDICKSKGTRTEIVYEVGGSRYKRI